jgi:hypothetical protein
MVTSSSTSQYAQVVQTPGRSSLPLVVIPNPASREYKYSQLINKLEGNIINIKKERSHKQNKSFLIFEFLILLEKNLVNLYPIKINLWFERNNIILKESRCGGLSRSGELGTQHTAKEMPSKKKARSSLSRSFKAIVWLLMFLTGI